MRDVLVEIVDTQIEDDALFCPNCGAKVEGAPEEPEKQAQQGPAPDSGPAGAKKPPKGGQKKKGSKKAADRGSDRSGAGVPSGRRRDGLCHCRDLTMQKDKALSQVEACGFQEYEEQAKAAAEEWERPGDPWMLERSRM